MLEEKLNPKNYIKQILINLEAANDNLVKTALKKENLKLVKNYLIFLIIIQVKKNHLLIFI